jgi:hypothetical protein
MESKASMEPLPPGLLEALGFFLSLAEYKEKGQGKPPSYSLVILGVSELVSM